MSDEVAAEKKTRILNVLDEYSRKCLLVVAQGTFKAKKLVAYLEQMVAGYGKSQYIRCDNGPELISVVMTKFALKYGIEIRYTQPGKPMQNGLVDSIYREGSDSNINWLRLRGGGQGHKVIN